MKDLYQAIKMGTTRLPDPNTFPGNNATIEIEFNGMPYKVTYQKGKVISRDAKETFVWGFESGFPGN